MKHLFYTCLSCGTSWEGPKKESSKRCPACGERRPVVSRHPPPIPLQDVGARYLGSNGNPSPGKQEGAE